MNHPYSNPASYIYATEHVLQSDSVYSIDSTLVVDPVVVDPAVAHSPLAQSKFRRTNSKPIHRTFTSFVPVFSSTESITLPSPTPAPSAWSARAPTITSPTDSSATDLFKRDTISSSGTYTSSHPYSYTESSDSPESPGLYVDYSLPHAVRRSTSRGHGQGRDTSAPGRRGIIRFSSEQDLTKSAQVRRSIRDRQKHSSAGGTVRFSLRGDSIADSPPSAHASHLSTTQTERRAKSPEQLSSSTTGVRRTNSRRSAASSSARSSTAVGHDGEPMIAKEREKERGRDPRPAWRVRIRRASLRLKRFFRAPSAPPAFMREAERDHRHEASQLSLV